MVLWSTLIYVPIAHWVWNPAGWLKGIGAIDFAGGIVVHVAAGISALAAALVVGRRKDSSCPVSPGSSVPWKAHMAKTRCTATNIQTNQHPIRTAGCSITVVWLVWIQRRKFISSKRLSSLQRL